MNLSNIQSLISSGVLELYVFGLASEEETSEVESLAGKHPEVQKELETIRKTLVSYASEHRVAPPEGLKERIQQRLEQLPVQKSKIKAAGSAPKSTPRIPAAAPISLNMSKLVVWLLGLGFIIAAAASFFFYQNAKSDRESLLAEQEQFRLFKDSIKQKGELETAFREQLNIIRQKETLAIQLRGTPKAAQAFAVFYFDGAAKRGYFDAVDLPELPTDMQYQLWTITNGKVSGLGKIELPMAEGKMQLIEGIEKPQSFIVTLESNKGAASPSLDNILLVGVVGRQ